MDHLPLSRNARGQGLILLTLALMAMGVVLVHSALASVARPGPWYSRSDMRHVIFAVLAAMVLLAGWRFDYHLLASGRKWPIGATVLLAGSLALCAAALIPSIGHEMGGDRRWLRVGPPQFKLGFQPSEILKLTVVIFLACWLTRPEVDVRSFRGTFVKAVVLVGISAALVITEDFGTGMIIGVGAAVTMLLAGVPWLYLLSLAPPGVLAFYGFVVCSQHRWARIAAMLDPWAVHNHQSRQSLLAVVSGGWFGKGLGAGTQKLGYLPEDSTDFIFSAACEETGVLGGCLLMGLLLVWMFLIRKAATSAPDRLGQVLAGSLGFLIAAQAVMHIAVDLAAMPPTGMTFPFLSAGGTALVLMAGGIALVVSTTAHSGRA
jgi:cell division protein FtsW